MYFEYLRRDAPITRHQPPEDLLGMRRRGSPGLLGDRSPRRHAADLARPGDVLLGPGSAVRRRATRAAGGIAVVPGDGRAAAHEAARARLGGVHAAPDQADRGRDPRQRQAHRRGGGADRRRRLRRADRQAAAAADDLGHARRARGRPRARGPGRRHADHRRRPGDDGPGLAARAARRGAVDADRVRKRAGGAPRAAPRRRPDDRARPGRGRRRAPHPRRDRGVPRAAVGRRQRHDASHHLARDARADRQTPTSARCCSRTSTRGCPTPSRSSCDGPRRC